MSGGGLIWDDASFAALRRDWESRWEDALAVWSRFTRLSPPRWCVTQEQELREGLTGSFAMIRLNDQAVVVSLRQIAINRLENYALEVLAHEIGHHVYAPGDLADNGSMIARMRRALPTLEHRASLVANLYTDLLINDRLQRTGTVDIAGVYIALGSSGEDPLWSFYMRTYEILWGLQRGTLARGEIDGATEGDAQLGARLIRSYAKDWLHGSGRFAALCFRYFAEEKSDGESAPAGLWRDMEHPGQGSEIPAGLTEIGEGEIEGAIHPALDRALGGSAPRRRPPKEPVEEEPTEQGRAGSRGQHREPYEYGEILRSIGIELDQHEVAVRYYRERALPHLIPFPTRIAPESSEPLAEGTEPWDIGSPLDDIDWFETVAASPAVFPGFTTLQRVRGSAEGSAPNREPIDLDLYIDSSGSMPDPQIAISYLTLAGAIIALSALRAGARVQATLWSGPGDFTTTRGFVTDEHMILRNITGYLGGSTAFPLPILRETYANRTPRDRAVHILHISDEGIDTILNTDERGGSGEAIARSALEKGRGGGTMALNLWSDIEEYPKLGALRGMGWSIHTITDWEELIAFGREFSRRTYGMEGR